MNSEVLNTWINEVEQMKEWEYIIRSWGLLSGEVKDIKLSENGDKLTFLYNGRPSDCPACIESQYREQQYRKQIIRSWGYIGDISELKLADGMFIFKHKVWNGDGKVELEICSCPAETQWTHKLRVNVASGIEEAMMAN